MDVKFDYEFQREDYNCRNIHNNTGLYFLYDYNNNLLYIGFARWVKSRIRQHLNGTTNTKRFQNEIDKVKIIYAENFDDIREQCPECGDIEYFMIDKLKPLYNITRHRLCAYKS